MKQTLLRLLFRAEAQELGDLREAALIWEGKFFRQAKEIARLRPKRARFDRYVAMGPEAMAETLAGSASLPQVKAVMELLDTKFQEAIDAAGDLNLTHAQTKYHLGGADWLVKLKAEIQVLTETTRETAQAGGGH